MTASRSRTPTDGRARTEANGSAGIAGREPGDRSPPGTAEVLLDLGYGRVKQLAPRDDHQVDPGASLERLIEPEHFSNQTFSAISPDSVTQLAGCNDSKPGSGSGPPRYKQSKKTGWHPKTGIESLLEFCFPSHALRLAETVRRHARARYDVETVRRLRPFARRRFKTKRPFLVAMRVRKPWVFFRRRRLGWKVRFMCRSLNAIERGRRNLNTTGGTQLVSTYDATIRHLERRAVGTFGGLRSVCYIPFPATPVGFPPEFSTVVEKIVEKPRFSPSLPPRMSRRHSGYLWKVKKANDSGVSRAVVSFNGGVTAGVEVGEGPEVAQRF